MLDIPCDEKANPAAAIGRTRNGGTAGFARDFGGMDGGALTFDRGVRTYSRDCSSGGTSPRKLYAEHIVEHSQARNL